MRGKLPVGDKRHRAATKPAQNPNTTSLPFRMLPTHVPPCWVRETLFPTPTSMPVPAPHSSHLPYLLEVEGPQVDAGT